MKTITEKLIYTDADGNACVVHPTQWMFDTHVQPEIKAVDYVAPVEEERDEDGNGIVEAVEHVEGVEYQPEVTIEDVWRMVIARNAEETGLPKSAFKRVPATAIPKDRTFRNAWKVNQSKLETDMPKAKELAKERIRAARKPKLEELDIEQMRAASSDALDAVIAKKNKLRDATADTRITSPKTEKTLKKNMELVIAEIEGG